ncbi:amidohydrolase [Mycobacteroides abscessus subsp. bolletii]|uniref:amidohydrolase family protein n=1 Tax=Mycobacteroides abscessus TaxID=36809 RepID=UPI0019D287FE|nr:amidohydrolase family protein [Mycobacteroides abscessus]MBN7300802.1 amidohydrolase [Mycobacteroides abscessus subsp. bolletii]
MLASQVRGMHRQGPLRRSAQMILGRGYGSNSKIFVRSRQVYLIGLEEHYATPAVLEAIGLDVSWIPSRPDLRLCDVSDGRIAAMNEAGIDRQVLSLVTPGVQELPPELGASLARQYNTELRESIIGAHPSRFCGFATLPMSAPEEAAVELERSVTELGLVGAMIHGRTAGRFLDDPRFDSILSCAESLNTPIYLHPGYPTPSIVDEYFSGFSSAVSNALGTAAIGWHQETAIHALRLVTSGVFDKYPNLRVILGHLGEGLPFYLPRVEEFLSPLVTNLRLPVAEYFRRNFWITTSGFTNDAVFSLAVAMFGADNIMFSVDYPFSDNVRTRCWFDALPIDEETRMNIAFKTALSLLRL